VCPDDPTLGTFNWVRWGTPISGKTATGTVGSVGVSYTSSENISTTAEVFAHSTFPAALLVPNEKPDDPKRARQPKTR